MSRAQLLACGLSRSAIAHRVRAGRLHRVLPGVYAVGHTALPEHGMAMAALLWRAPDAVLSHGTAAYRWGILAADPPKVHLSSAGRAADARPGVVLHRRRALAQGDVRCRHGLRLTSPSRTVLDLGDVLPPSAVENAVAEARVLGLVTDRELRRLVEHGRGRRGVALLRRLAAAEAGPALTRSEAERLLLALLRRARIRAPRTNVRVLGFEVDALWPEERLVAEVDGFAFHGSRRAFERDRARIGDLQAAGYRVIPVTWRQLTEEPEAVVARIAGALARRGAA